jgi:DNA end-binding protein Ku
MPKLRSLWTGSLSFGLVNVPVALVPATRDRDLHFHNIHRKTHERLHVSYVCTKEQAPVDPSEIAHGYDTGDGYVMLTDEELAAAAPEKTRTIDIARFVDLAEIDPIYFEQPYHLLPVGEGDGPRRAYRLLADVMDDAGKAAIGQFVLRTREHVVAVRAKDGGLSLTTMLFAHEVRPTDDLDLPTRKRPSKAKVDQAAALVEALGDNVDHDAYKDRYRDRLRKVVKDKEAGETIKAPRAPRSPGAPPDLMEALKASLDEVRGSSGDGGSRSGKAKRS